MSTRQFVLPDLGEGLTEAEIARWAVQVGDAVALNQIIVEVETAKALVEIPSPYAGVVEAILADEGASVDVGVAIIRFADDAPNGEPPADAPESVETEAAPERQSVLVGYGPGHETTARRRRTSRQGAPPEVASPPVIEPTPEEIRPTRALAKPPVRKLAKERGIDLLTLTGTGIDGQITRRDLEEVTQKPPPPVTQEPDAGASRTNRDTRVPLAGVRKRVADAMTRSAFTAPHVTEFVTVDVTRTVRLVERLRSHEDLQGFRITPMLIAARALTAALRSTPALNSSLDAEAGEIVLHGAVNLGIAVSTPRGLLVPNIRDVGSLSFAELAAELSGLVDRARAGRTSVAELAGGTITITNIGGFGIDTGTPIINPGEAAILCMGVIREQPWNHKGRIALRSVMTLSLSFDHRLADGLEGSALLRDVASTLSDPTRLIVSAR